MERGSDDEMKYDNQPLADGGGGGGRGGGAAIRRRVGPSCGGGGCGLCEVCRESSRGLVDDVDVELCFVA